jgi:hypothetical protein
MKQKMNNWITNNWRTTICMITLSLALSYIYKNELLFFINNLNKSNIAKDPKEIIQYSNGIILDKILDVGKNEQLLIYKNNNNDVFTINKPELWKLTKPYDSVRVGYIQDTTSKFNQINFVSIKKLGVSKDTLKNFKIISTSNNRRFSKSVIIRKN